jgi:hypothetical protein
MLALRPKWKLFPRCKGIYDPTVTELARSLHPKKILCQRLTPHTRGDSRPNTLSSRYGLDILPAHTDFATAEIPPRYILLTAPRPRSTDTLIFDANDLIGHFGIDHLLSCLFLNHGKTKRYCRLLTVPNGELLFRYNRAVMEPKNSEAEDVEIFINTKMKNVCRINWRDWRIAAIDNWATFHARDVCVDTDRVGLFRFAIWGENNDLDN